MDAHGYPRMLNRAGWIKKARACDTDIRPAQLPHHALQPGSFERFDIIVKKYQSVSGGDPCSQIIHSGEMERAGISHPFRSRRFDHSLQSGVLISEMLDDNNLSCWIRRSPFHGA